MENATMKPIYQIINGIRTPMLFRPECFKEALSYKARTDDVFILSYPKCGTTWMQNITLSIFRKGKELEDPRYFHRLTPFIDYQGNEGINNMPRPGAFKTHIPYNLAPYSASAKYIIVLRNPKDCCVSMYHHTKRMFHKYNWDESFDVFFEMFMNGEVEYNDYFDHLMSWYPHRHDKQIFFTTYEDMKKDTKDIVLKLACFLGQQYIGAIEKDNNVLCNILEFSSFEYMKKYLSACFVSRNIKVNNPVVLKHTDECKNSSNSTTEEQLGFFRKGIVGDSKNYLSEAQSERLNNKFLERLQGTDIVEMYNPYM